VKAVLRRTHGKVQESYEETLEFNSMVIDPRTRLVILDGKEKSLTAKEFELLWLLARHPRQVFTRDQLLERVWDTEYVDPSTVTVHIRRLREKIESDPSKPRHVMTAWGVGYKFEP
jgi:DNA-binding response OmpR family regulator